MRIGLLFGFYLVGAVIMIEGIERCDGNNWPGRVLKVLSWPLLIEMVVTTPGTDICTLNGKP